MSDVQIVAPVNPDPLHDVKPFKFGFRTVKDKETGTESKRPNVEVNVKVLSFEGLVEVLQKEGKEKDLVFAAIHSVYEDYIKDLLADDEKITTENFPYDKVTWEAIANLPETERKGRGIPKEIWEEFVKDYLAVMPGLSGKTEEQIKTQASLLSQKLNPLRNIEKARKERIIPGLKTALTVYVNGSANAEQFVDCIEYLNKRADVILAVDAEANLEANLGFN
jgi:hypothetical protein